LPVAAEVNLKLHLDRHQRKEKAVPEVAEANLATHQLDNLHLLLQTLRVIYLWVVMELVAEHGALDQRVLQEL
tara:strand:- start:68 stop:286 length:219 start_codon:yes stop_codon:yes gene_type:complete